MVLLVRLLGYFLDKSRLVTQALEIKAKAVYRRIIENPCVGGSIPPRATTEIIEILAFALGFLLLGACNWMFLALSSDCQTQFQRLALGYAKDELRTNRFITVFCRFGASFPARIKIQRCTSNLKPPNANG